MEYNNVIIGPTPSNIQRKHLGSINFSSKDISDKIKEKYFEIIIWVHKCHKIINTSKPDLIFLNESNDWNKPIVDIAIKNIDVIQYAQPFKDNALIFKRLNRETYELILIQLLKTPLRIIK